VAEFGRMRELLATIHAAVTADGDAGREEAGPRPPRCGSCGAASTGRRRFDPDRTGQLFRDVAVQLGDLHAAEAAAVDETRRARPAP